MLSGLYLLCKHTALGRMLSVALGGSRGAPLGTPYAVEA
jgi:hypothetical protein